MFARRVVLAALFAPWLPGCAETPAVKAPVAPLASPSARLELEAVVLDRGCSSPYPISELRAKVIAGDGKAYATPIFTPNGLDTGGLSPLEPSELSGKASFGQFITGLFYFPPVDLLPVIGSDLVVNAWLTRQPSVRARLVIPPRFDCPQYLNLSGRPGGTGTPSQPGGKGEPGPSVRIAIGYLERAGAKPLILVRVDDARGMRARAVISPDGPPLQIFLDGGAGGPGGLPSVPLQQPSASSMWGAPMPGPWNFPGQGGAGGDGGAAAIGYDDAAPELEGKVLIVNRGGLGATSVSGNGPTGRPGPLPRTEPIPVRRLFPDEIAHGVSIRVHGAVEPAKTPSL
jgi:hypothetical protein